jgi:hypothetical protein
LAWLFGVVLGSLGVLLFACYVVSSWLLSVRTRFILAAVAVAFAALPWLGFGPGDFVYPGTDWLLPSLDISNVTRNRFGLWYSLAVEPLNDVAQWGPSLSQFVYIPTWSVARVRPFVVFATWASIALMLGLSGATGLIPARMAARRDSPSGVALGRVRSFIRTAVFCSMAIFLAEFACLAAVGGLPWPDDTPLDRFASRAMALAFYAGGPVIACIRRGELPAAGRSGVYGALLGLLAGMQLAAILDPDEPWKSSWPFAVCVPLGLLVGAFGGAIARAVWDYRSLGGERM